MVLTALGYGNHLKGKHWSYQEQQSCNEQRILKDLHTQVNPTWKLPAPKSNLRARARSEFQFSSQWEWKICKVIHLNKLFVASAPPLESTEKSRHSQGVIPPLFGQTLRRSWTALLTPLFLQRSSKSAQEHRYTGSEHHHLASHPQDEESHLSRLLRSCEQ